MNRALPSVRVALFTLALLAASSAPALPQPAPRDSSALRRQLFLPRALDAARLRQLAQGSTQDGGWPNLSVQSVAVENAETGSPVFRVTLMNSGTGSAFKAPVRIRSPENAWAEIPGTIELVPANERRDLALPGGFTLAPGTYAFEVLLLDGIDPGFRSVYQGSFVVPVPLPAVDLWLGEPRLEAGSSSIVVPIGNRGPATAHAAPVRLQAGSFWVAQETAAPDLAAGATAAIRFAANQNVPPGSTAAYLLDILPSKGERETNPSDNRGVGALAWPARAPSFDVAVSFVSHEAREGQPARFVVRVSNSGPDSSSAGRVRLELNGVASTGARIPVLPAGGSLDLILVATIALGPGPYEAVAHIDTPPVDAFGFGTDANASNDEARLDVTVVAASSGVPGGSARSAFPWAWLLLGAPLALFSARVRQGVRRVLRIPPRVQLVPIPGNISIRVADEARDDASWDIEVTMVRGVPRVRVEEHAATEPGGGTP
jgi:hypothetical protein